MTVWQGRRGGILACFFLLALANCGGGGGGGDSGGGGTVIADFAPACLTTDVCYSSSVTLQKGMASGDTVGVQAVLNKLNTPIGVASLLIGFDSTVAQFICSQANCVDGFAEGPALGTSAQGTTYLVTLAPGELLVDVLPPIGGKSISSAQVILTLSFKALKVGSTGLVFKSVDTLNGSALFRPDESIILLFAAGWSGGLLTGS
ncbi:MAG TPA: cohesin domain-containing protein [Candidatus Polarisedimenticolia bacterium]|nr:cohesin domain-containing protein [Candidatus Polarisedimenticolia bacterium]